ncbi:MAG: sigma-54-dependent Fis family transcriptional regulator [Myxococcales bacterium]|nr:sigma-54-dependent Fis family transcriptional regulator [Myxococcales bacterium]
MAERTVTEHAQYAVGSAGSAPVIGLVLVPARAGDGLTLIDVSRPLSVGRDESSDIVLDDAGASRAHARFEQRGEQVLVSDLGSRNGTWVDAAPASTSGTLARPHSVIRIGRSLFVVADLAPYARPRPGELAGLYGGASLDDAREAVLTIAPTKSAVLILGETGTGKEVIARLVHEASGRGGPFVALNCAAVPSELVDAELFGHARGAFSGAAKDRTGLFRTAHGGTLFLDEIGEMPAAVQAKLLRTLETGEVRPVGDDHSLTVDTRVVAATNREVDQLIESGSFRGDLLHRLAGLRIRLPPLRERREDVPLLAQAFALAVGAEVSPAAFERLMLHPWPGNVRELRNVIAAATEVARRKGRPEITEEDVTPLLILANPKSTPPSRAEQTNRRVTDALTEAAGDVAQAAALLGMGRSALYETLRRLDIDPRGFRRR